MKLIYPELIYVCPLIEDSFRDPKEYCGKTAASVRMNDPRKCPHYNGVKRDGWGPNVSFDVIKCEYHSSASTARDKDE